MLNNTMFDVLDTGIFTYDKKNTLIKERFTTYFLLYGDFENILVDDEYKNLVNFLNIDFHDLTELATQIIEYSYDRINKSRKFISTYASFCNELFFIHPYFQYESFFHACDILLNLWVSIFLNMPLVDRAKIDLPKSIKYICNSIYSCYDPAPCSPNVVTSLISCYSIDYTPFYWGSSENKEPIHFELEQFRDYIARNIPQLYYNHKSANSWNDFLACLDREYNAAQFERYPYLQDDYNDYIYSLEKLKQLAPKPDEAQKPDKVQKPNKAQKPDNIMDDPSLSIAKKIVGNLHAYKIHSLPNYTYAQLDCVKWNKRCIKYCYVCRKYYTDSALIDHPCLTQDYYKNMVKIRDKTRDRIVKRCTDDISNQQMEKFMTFHLEMWHNALQKHMSEKEYDAYTHNELYNVHDFEQAPKIML